MEIGLTMLLLADIFLQVHAVYSSVSLCVTRLLLRDIL